MDLSTTARAKIVLGLTSSQHDTLLDQLVAATSGAAERYLNRHALQTARTEQYDVEDCYQRRVYLRGFPVLATPVAAFKSDGLREFTGAAIDADNYYLDLERGTIEFDVYTLTPGPGTLQVVYTGGMATTAAGLISAFPDVAQAVDFQVAFLFKRRDTLGMSSFSAEGGSIGFETPVELIPLAKRLLDPYRRIHGGN